MHHSCTRRGHRSCTTRAPGGVIVVNPPSGVIVVNPPSGVIVVNPPSGVIVAAQLDRRVPRTDVVRNSDTTMVS
jgi:hypothetical protein